MYQQQYLRVQEMLMQQMAASAAANGVTNAVQHNQPPQSAHDTSNNNNNNNNSAAAQSQSQSSTTNHHTSKLSSSLEEVLRQNREYQSFLTKELGKLEQLLGINSEKRRLAEQLLEKLDTASSSGRGNGRQSSSLQSSSNTSSASHKLFLSQHGLDGPIPRKAIFASPFFVDAHGQTPPDNPDTIRKRRLRGAMPLVHRFIKWSREEKAQLMLGVKHQNQRFLMQKELEEVKSHFRQTGTLGDMNNAKLKEINSRIQAITPDEFVLDVEKIDWQLLSKKYVRSRSAIDCKIHWTGVLDPRINHDPFTKEEETKLVQLANEKINSHSHHHGSAAKNWIEIAAKLQTNRTAMQCFQRFQRSLNANLILSKWKPEEDKRLMEEVAKYGEKNWQTVAAKMKMRTDQQCLHRWTKSVDPTIRSGRWTPQEDLRLRLAIKAYGAKNWNRIQQHVPGRTDVKCRERWTNVLDPALSKDAWSEEEDQKLKELAIKYNNNWSKIAREMPTRTDNQCWRRWKKKVADRTQLEVRKRDLEKQKRMVKNFVGRAGERPILTADDVSEALGANATSTSATAATVANASGATNAIAIARPAMLAGVVPASVVPATNVTAAAAASAAALAGVALLPSLGLNVHHPNTVVGMSDLISFNKQVASVQQNQQQHQKSLNDISDQSNNNINVNNAAANNAATTAAAAALSNPVLNAAAVRAQAAGLFPIQQQQLLQMQLLLQPMGAAAAINQPFLNPLLAMAPTVAAGANASTLAQISQLMQQQQQQQLQQLQQVAQQQVAAQQAAAQQQQQQQQAQQQSNNRNAQNAENQGAMNRDVSEQQQQQQTSAQQRRKERDHQQQQRRNEREREREREQAQHQQQQQQDLSSLHLTHDDEGGLHEGDELRAPTPHSPSERGVVDSIDVHGDGSSRAHVHSHSHQDQHAEHAQNEDQGHHYHDDHSHPHDVNEYPELHAHHDSPDLLPSHPHLHADHEDASSHLLHTMITDDEHPSFLPDQNAPHHHLHDSHTHGHSHHDSHSTHGDNHPDDRHHTQHHHSLHEDDDENATFDANEGFLNPLHFQGPQPPNEGDDEDSQQPQSDVGVGSKRKAGQAQNARKRAKSNLNQDGSDPHYDQHDE